MWFETQRCEVLHSKNKLPFPLVFFSSAFPASQAEGELLDSVWRAPLASGVLCLRRAPVEGPTATSVVSSPLLCSHYISWGSLVIRNPARY